MSDREETTPMHRFWKLYSLAFSLLLGFLLSIPASGQTFTSIDYPGAAWTIATGVNFKGTIVGDFCTICKPHEVVRGYILSQGMFTEIDFPGAAFTRPLGINDDGDIVGFYRDNPTSQDHGFLLSGGSFSSIDFPGASQTHAIGIDLAGDIFGGYCSGGNACYTPGENVHGFRLSGGIFTTIDFPGAIFTEAWRQDRAGQIAGRYQDANGVFHIFLLNNGSFTSIDFPGAAETAPSWYAAVGGFNAGGDIASVYCTAEPCTNPSPSGHSFLLKNGQFTSFDPPSSLGSEATGINSIDEIVGIDVGEDGRFHGYLRTP
jgi:uncharacterized membrane protein